jgi:hypothetical protein
MGLSPSPLTHNLFWQTFGEVARGPEKLGVLTSLLVHPNIKFNMQNEKDGQPFFMCFNIMRKIDASMGYTVYINANIILY